MNQSFSITIKLQQHSPIIHFQHDQQGACLRATELKPKLDKFIIREHFNKKFAAYKHFLVEYEHEKYTNLNAKEKKDYIENIHEALDYKITILSPTAIEEDIKHSLFFGNLGKSHKDKKSISLYLPHTKDITLEIFSIKSDLMDIIKLYLSQLFAVENFGTRQDKGFGSYFISIRDQRYHKDISDILPEGTFYIEINTIDDREIFTTIAYYYKRLKSGINQGYQGECKKGYHKAYLYKYLEEKCNYDWTWEKRWLKETFFGLLADKKNKKFARALLGLPGCFTFKATDEPCNLLKDKIKIYDDYEIEVYNKEIARIQSPITFKIIKDFQAKKSKVFILVNHELIKEIEKICRESREFQFKPKFRLKYENYRDKGRIKYKSKLIPWKKGLQDTDLEKYEKIYPSFIKKAEVLEENGDRIVKGQKARFREFQDKNFTDVTIVLPGEVIDYQDLISNYNEQELKGRIDDRYEKIRLKAYIKRTRRQKK